MTEVSAAISNFRCSFSHLCLRAALAEGIDKGCQWAHHLLVPTNPTTISAPKDWVLSVSRLQFPKSTDQRLGELMDKNTEGALSVAERRELEALVEISEELSLVRAEALQLLEGAVDAA